MILDLIDPLHTICNDQFVYSNSCDYILATPDQDVIIKSLTVTIQSLISKKKKKKKKNAHNQKHRIAINFALFIALTQISIYGWLPLSRPCNRLTHDEVNRVMPLDLTLDYFFIEVRK